MGTPAFVDGPHGTLCVAGRREPGIALIAGGVGVAPMLGILRELQLTDDPRPATLVLGNRIEEQIVVPDELAALDARDRMSVVSTLSEPGPGWSGETGLIDADLIGRSFPQEAFERWLFLLCGPPPMLAAVEATLLARGVGPERILSERFQYD